MTKSFYTSFRDCVINSDIDNMDETDRRVVFQMEMYKKIPKSHHKLLFSVMRSYPTPVIYAFLSFGILGTNIARYCTVSRPGCHDDQAERTSALYNFIGESRFGKGVAINLLMMLGKYVENLPPIL